MEVLLQQLFDMCSCQCKSEQGKIVCRCEKGKRVPLREVPFLLDQRELRQMQIGILDTKVTKRPKSISNKEETIKMGTTYWRSNWIGRRK